ncbi:MAG: hypothetical protein PWP23_943 [Candidatus Sumerlaeota bacterium]|nr:hypothetical protein [Candidatus Sumerlaeota bacterium]
MKTNFVRLIAGILLLLTGSLSWANGCFSGPIHMGAPPEVPQQAACIVYEEGRETLIVQSTMESTGEGDFAWVLPVPAVPESIQEAEPGILECLSWINAPWLVVKETLELPFLLIALVAVTFFSGLIFGRAGGRGVLVLLVLASLCVLLLCSPNYLVARAGGSVPEALLPLAEQIVGNYRTAVLQAKEPEDLQEWLRENGYGELPESGVPIIREYIEEGWVFVTAKLVKQEGETLAPHPLQVTFETDAPVFPMRLTAVAETETLVDLYVISSTPWKAAELDTWARWDSKNGLPSSGKGFKRSRIPRAVLNYPAMVEFLPEEFWMVRLRGTLTPEKMRESDIVLKPAVARDYLIAFTTSDVRLHNFARRTLRLTPFLFLIGAVAFGRREQKGRIGKFVLMLTVGVGVAGLISLFQVLRIPLMEEREVVGTVSGFTRAENVLWSEYRMRETLFADDRKWDPEELRQHILETYRNPIRDRPIREEESPGNFHIVQNKDGEWVLRTFPLDRGYVEVAL